MNKFTLEEYKEKLNMAPIMLEDFAEEAMDVSDDLEFVAIARSFLRQKEMFERALEKRSIEVG